MGSVYGEDVAVLELKGKLADGKLARVNSRFLKELNKYRWHCNNFGYVTTVKYLGGGSKNPKYKTIYLHKLVMELAGIKSDEADHSNHDLLDNTLANLRPCNRSQNQHNKRLFKTNKSGYKGVCWNKFSKRWQAATSINKKRYFLGYFSTPEEVAKVYDTFVRKNMGEFAAPNKVNYGN